MSRITTLLSVATHRLDFASIYPHTPAAPAIPAAHAAGGPILVALLIGVACVVLLSRVNKVLVGLVSQIVQVASAVGRMLIMILILVVIGTLVLIHG